MEPVFIVRAYHDITLKNRCSTTSETARAVARASPPPQPYFHATWAAVE